MYSDLQYFLRMYLPLQIIISSFLNWFFLNNYLELEKEIEELKSKPVAGGTDDIIKVMQRLQISL